MCDQATSQAIEASIDSLVQQRTPFTAYDISRAMWKNGVKEPHREMKRVVHSVFNDSRMGDYHKTLVQFPNSPAPCFLYHPPEVDPSTYVQQGQTAPAVLAGPAAQAAVQSATDDTEDDEEDDGAVPVAAGTASVVDKTLNADAQVLYVPTTMAQALKIDPSGTAYMTIDNDKLSITSTPPTPDTKTVHVDRNQNIRIGRTAMNKIGIDGKVHIEINGNEIVISKA